MHLAFYNVRYSGNVKPKLLFTIFTLLWDYYEFVIDIGLNENS